MKYIAPVGGAANDPYIDFNVGTGEAGSIPPAAAIEAPQREIMAVIENAGLDGDANDLTQLYQAIGALISAQNLGTAALRDVGTASGNVPEVLSATGKLSPSIIPSTSTDVLHKKLLLNSLLDAMSVGASLSLIDAQADPYADVSKINAGASSGYSHDSVAACIDNLSLTEVTPPSATSSMGNQAGTTVATIIDGDWATSWDVNDSQNWQNNYITFDAGAGNLYTVRQFKMSVNNIGAWGTTTFTVKGSNDDVSYDTIASGVSITFVTSNVAALSDIFANTTAYRYIRLVCEDSRPGPSNDVSEVHLMDASSASDLTLVSVAYAATAEPTTGYLLGLIEPIDAITLDVDLLADLSKDGGTTWEAVALQQIGTTTEGYLVVYGDLTFVAGGAQSVVDRWRTFNGKRIKLHGTIIDAEA